MIASRRIASPDAAPTQRPSPSGPAVPQQLDDVEALRARASGDAEDPAHRTIVAAARYGSLSVPRVSAIVAVGVHRERGRRCIEALLAQSAIGEVETIVIDIAPEGAAPLGVDESAVRLVRRPGGGWGETRSVGLGLATGDIVGFVEDHCVPERDWAAALIRAYEQPWDAVGYAFTNANPNSYVSEASLMTDYGRWLTPAAGGRVAIPPEQQCLVPPRCP